jgi:hypothetical protein
MIYQVKIEKWMFMLTSFLASRMGEGSFSGSREGSYMSGREETG